MSSNVDSRIVTMKFDNAQFERAVGTTMGTLDKLKKSLSFEGAAKGLGNVQGAIDKVNFSHLEGGITGVSNKFLAMSAVAVTALSNITNRAVDAGLNLAKSLTITPIKAGFDEYELKLGSIQTILANTARHGTTLEQVTAALDDLNTYSDKTIFNFGEMTKNIGLFTNAGIKVEDATSMIKGFSNVAAASGTSAEGAAGAAYQLSQALSSGKVTLMDWKSLTNVGMGNKNMQDSIIGIAQAMGTFKGTGIGANDAQAHFNETLEKGWLTADVMSSYLKIMAGDMDVTQMKAMGLSDSMIATFQSQQQTAENAATKVRTFTQLLGTVREAVGSGWSKTFELIVGDFNEATDLFTSINNTIGGFIQASADARNKVIGDWKALGGRTVLIEALKNAFQALMNIIKPIKDAFREIFPPKTGQDLFDLTTRFRDFTAKLKLSDEGMANLKKTFKGIFAIFSIAKQVIGGVVGVIFDLIGAFTGAGKGAGGGILAFTGSIGELVTSFDAFLKSSEIIPKIFDTISAAVVPVIGFITKLRTSFFNLLSGGVDSALAKWKESFEAIGPVVDFLWEKFRQFNNFIQTTFPGLADIFGFGPEVEKSASQVGLVTTQLEKVPTVLDKVKAAWNEFTQGLGDFFGPIWENIKKGFGVIKTKLMGFIQGMGIKDGLALINTGFFIALYAMLRKFVGKMSGLVDNMSSMFENAGGVFEQLTANLKSMQNEIRAEMILKIAAAVALLAAALWVLSKIDPAKLGIALGAITVMLAELIGAIMLLEKNKDTSLTGGARVMVISTALIALATAILILSAAVAILGTMETDTLIRGISAIGGILAIVVAAAAILEKTGGAAQILVASAAILILSAALIAFAGALKLYANLDTQVLLVGGAKIAGALLAIGIGMRAMPPDILASAASLLIISAALVILSYALGKINELGIGEMVKTAIMLGVTLKIITNAMWVLQRSMTAAKSLFVVSAALVVFAVAMKILGSLDIGDIAIAMAALAGVFLVLGVAAAIFAATGLVVIIQALAVALALMGAAMLLAGAGMLLFALGLASLAVTGAAGAAALVAAIVGVAMTIPLIAEQIGLGILAFAKVIAEGGPVMVEAFTTLIISGLQAMIDVMPKFREFMSSLISMLLDLIVENYPKFIQAGFDLLISLLNGIRDNLQEVSDAATDLVVEFFNVLGNEENVKRMSDAGFQMVIDVMNGLSRSIDENSQALHDAGVKLAWSIVNGISTTLTGQSAKTLLRNAVTTMLGPLGAIANKVLDAHSPSKVFMKIGEAIPEGMVVGINSGQGKVDASVEDMASGTMDTMKSSMSRLGDAISADIEVQPVITPVLDLTQVEKDASNINSLLSANSISASISLNRATEISQSQQMRAQANTDGSTSTERVSTLINFEQNNHSPKALSTVEIYRQTKNQLSLAKEALSV